jgi:hypothetical protein
MLRDAHERGREDALRHFGVKTARGAAGMPMGAPMHPALAEMHANLQAAAPAPATPAPPAAAPRASWADMHRGVQQQQAASVGPPAAMPTPAPAAQSLAPAATPAAARGAGGFMRPIKRGLGLAVLGTAGALAYGAHQQNQRDREGRDLIYAPMTGGY